MPQPDYNDDLVFPPKEEVLSMPRCDIVELQNKIKNLKELLKSSREIIDRYLDAYSVTDYDTACDVIDSIDEALNG